MKTLNFFQSAGSKRSFNDFSNSSLDSNQMYKVRGGEGGVYADVDDPILVPDPPGASA
ncbi:MAG TPA: hypothetical protein VE912_22980 [Bacteroidales bacterium]|nr:hypothetical protein [Bacteroidales bacterium]